MSKTSRRKVLCSLSGAIMLTAGCQQFQSESFGTLIIENQHDLPHIVTLQVIRYSPDDETEHNTEWGQISIEPEETKRYTDYFDVSRSYEVDASIPNAETSPVPYGREGVPTEGNLVFFEISESGTLNGGLRSV